MKKIIILLKVILIANADVCLDQDARSRCQLDPDLVKEIASYKGITTKIRDEIVNKELGKKMYKEFTKFIDTFGSRPSGTKNLENSIDYMINLTKIGGINDVKTEEVDVPRWNRKFERIVMLQPHEKEMALLGLGYSVSTPPEGIVAEVVVVKNFEELEKLDDSFVKGKIVVFRVIYETYFQAVVYRIEGADRAAKKGAVAALVRSITPFSLYTPHTGALLYSEKVTKIPSAAITLEDADLIGRLNKEGHKIILNLTMINELKMEKSRNTIIDLKGTQHPNKTVIVSGHIDSWDVGEGAMDDGAGMFISWYAPVILNQLQISPKRTLRAILWTSEEFGLIGAKSYLKRHEHELNDINFIMESDEGTFAPLGLNMAGSCEAVCIIKEILKLFTPIDKLQVSDEPGSDITVIIPKGVPGASLINKSDRYFWYHHTNADTMDVLSEKDVIDCAAFWAAVSYVIADISKDIPRKSHTSNTQ